jgi:hypothetical protein
MNNKLLITFFVSIYVNVSAQTVVVVNPEAKSRPNASHFVDYPSYSEIVNKYFFSIPFENIEKSIADEKLRFEKRPTGWYIVHEVQKSSTQIEDDFLFWDRNTKTYKKGPYGNCEDSIVIKPLINGFLEKNRSAFFDLYPYFGYPGWEIDVINELEAVKDKTDTIYYLLGRSYSEHALSLIGFNPRFENQKTTYSFDLQQYELYHAKAIESFEQVHQMNPKYATHVGNIKVKLSNEYMLRYLIQHIHDWEKDTKASLRKDLYNDLFIALAKNHLNSCAPGAVLFCNGDIPTFSLLYTQIIYGFRTDVLVVNNSLLNYRYYFEKIQLPFLDSKGLNSSFDLNQYENLPQSLTLNKNQNETTDVELFIEKIKQLKNENAIETSNYIAIEFNDDYIDWKIPNEKLTKSDVLTLDAIAQNYGIRPIFFSNDFESSDFIGLNGYLYFEGLARKLTPFKHYKTHKWVSNTQVMYDNLMNNFYWVDFKSLTGIEEMICTNYIVYFNLLASDLIEEKKWDKAKNTLNKCFSIFPESSYHLFPMTLIIENFYKIQDFEKGNYIYRKAMEKIKSNALVDEPSKKHILFLESIAQRHNQYQLLNK